MKKILNILFVMCLFCTIPAVCEEITPMQEQYLSDTKATITVQKQPSKDANQKQVIQNIRWAIIIQCQGKAIDNPANSDNK